MSVELSASAGIARNYPLNCWWVAAFSDEIENRLLGRWLLDTPVVLYRKSDGSITAMEDRCPHRAAPLSMGRLIDDTVQCGYHGFRFNREGKCVLAPSVGRPLPAVTVPVYPVIENPPLVWIYLGDPTRIDDVPLPPLLDWMNDDRFHSVNGRLDIAANYLLLKENVLDATHFGFVHSDSFKITDIVSAPSFESDATTTTFRQHVKGSPLAAMYAEPLGLKTGTPYDRETWGSFLSPALQAGGVDFICPASGDKVGRFRTLHATTPVDDRNMLYFWLIARDFGTAPEEMNALEKLTLIGFSEDENMLVAIQQMNDRYSGHAMPEVSVKADTAGVQARRLIDYWMTRETIANNAGLR